MQKLNKKDEEIQWHLPLNPILNRLSGIARNLGYTHKKFVFQIFASLIESFSDTMLHPDYFDAYLSPIFIALYKTLEKDSRVDHQGNTGFEEAKVTASGVCKILEEKLGTSQYDKFYNKARLSIIQSREENRQKRKVQAVVDPQAVALKKKKKAEKKKNTKKRKVESEQWKKTHHTLKVRNPNPH